VVGIEGGCGDEETRAVASKQSAEQIHNQVLSVAGDAVPTFSAWRSRNYYQSSTKAPEDSLDSSYIHLEEVRGGLAPLRIPIRAAAGESVDAGKMVGSEAATGALSVTTDTLTAAPHEQQQEKEAQKRNMGGVAISKMMDTELMPALLEATASQPEGANHASQAPDQASRESTKPPAAEKLLPQPQLQQQKGKEPACTASGITTGAPCSSGVPLVTAPSHLKELDVGNGGTQVSYVSGGHTFSLEEAWKAAAGLPLATAAAEASNSGAVQAEPISFAAAWAAATRAGTKHTAEAVGSAGAAGASEELSQVSMGQQGAWAAATASHVLSPPASAPLPQLPSFNVAVDASTAQLMKEMAVMKNLDHPNVVKLFEVCQVGGHGSTAMCTCLLVIKP
jgi:hypothetical protein